MLCCICKEKEATVHLTQTGIAADKIQRLDLCEKCAETYGVNDLMGLPYAERIHACEQLPFSDREAPK